MLRLRSHTYRHSSIIRLGCFFLAVALCWSIFGSDPSRAGDNQHLAQERFASRQRLRNRPNQQGSTSAIPGTTDNQDSLFVVSRDESGDITCRDATKFERDRMIERTNGGPTRVIYSGAPPRDVIGSTRWTLPSSPGLSLLPSAGLRIILHGTVQLDQNQLAKNAFIVAANRWESLIASQITVVLDVDFGSTFFGEPYPSSNLLGVTGTNSWVGSYSSLRQRLIDGASTTIEQQLYAALPFSAVPIELNGASASVTNARATLPNARALGLVADITNPDSIPLGQGDAGIGFNSAFAFDFNPDDGISPNFIDFDSVASHEIGHALGFVSNSGGPNASATVAVWDLFRFRPETANLGTFETAQRVMSIGGSQIFFGNQQNTFATQELSLSTGGPNPAPNDGDGRQSSHWKDDVLSFTRPYIGVMDPTLASGRRRTLSENDVRAIDLFGYSIGGLPLTRPPNDNFADAIVLAPSGSFNGTNINGTREANEPLHADFMGDKSIWFSWVAPLTGLATFDTLGSNFDSTLAVYTGSSVNQLQLIQSNDDALPGGTSRVQFSVNNGTTYRIAVDGWNGEFGNVILNWSSGAAPTPTPTPTPTPIPSPTPTPTPTPSPTPAADLAIQSFVASPNPVGESQFVSLAVEARNLGPFTATDTTISIVLPSGVSFASCTPTCTGPGTSNGGTVVGSFGNLPPTASFTLTVSALVTAQSGTVLSSTATLSSSVPDPNTTNNSASVSTTVIELIPFSEVKKISVRGHALALRNGTVWAWGHNYYGQLGDGTTDNRNHPVQVDDLMFIEDIGAGGGFSVALKNDGTVWTWGDNSHGQLGLGFVVPSIRRPSRIPTLTSVIAISVGASHSLALKSDGTVWSWGWNSSGELGIGTTDFGSHPTPVQVPDLTGVVRIFAGASLSYATKSDGSVWGWGSRYSGQLGDGTTLLLGVPSPMQLASLNGIVQVGSGGGFTIVRKADGTVLSFGGNFLGRLGRGISDIGPYPVPTEIPDLTANYISSGGEHSIAVDTSGSLKAFGSNRSGQLGLGFPDQLYHPSPVSVPGVSGAFATVGGSESSFALIGNANTGGTVRAWGSNDSGVLGIGTLSPAYTPTVVAENLTVAMPNFSAQPGTILATPIYIACGTPGAVIHYTTNGSDPTESDPVIASGSSVMVDHSLTLKARAYRNGFSTSAIRSATYTVVSQINRLSGRVVDYFGNSVRNWTVNLTGSQISSAVTDETGFYSFDDLPNGSYTLTPAAGGPNTVAASENINNLNGDITVNLLIKFFVTFHVSVVENSGIGMNGVDISLNDAPPLVKTNAAGLVDIVVNAPVTSVLGEYIRVSPLKTGYSFSPLIRHVPNWNGDQQVTFLGSASSLLLLMDSSGPASDQLAALDGLLFLRDPFQVVNSNNLFGSTTDRNTRVVIFATGVQLSPFDPPSTVMVNLVASNNQSYDIPAQAVSSVPNTDFTQITFRLPEGLAAGVCTIKVVIRVQTSNTGTIRISP